MKAHKYWSIGALITMIGTFYTGYKGSKSGHRYFACSTLICMIMSMYTGHKMISGNKKTRKQNIQSFILHKSRHQKFTYKANIPFHINKTSPCIFRIQGPAY